MKNNDQRRKRLVDKKLFISAFKSNSNQSLAVVRMNIVSTTVIIVPSNYQNTVMQTNPVKKNELVQNKVVAAPGPPGMLEGRGGYALSIQAPQLKALDPLLNE